MSSGILSRSYQLQMPSGTLYHVAVVRTDVSEKVSSQFSGSLRVISQYCCRGIAFSKVTC
jgi:hypothetical protein